MILCGVDGFRTHRTDSGYSDDCHWSNHPWAGPSSQTLWQRPMEKIEGDREGAPDRWNNSYCRGTLVRSSRYRTQGTQDKVSFAGLAMKKRANNRNILRSASTTRGTRPLSKEENSTASFLTRTRNPTGIYASLMKVARTMDIRQSVSFVSKFPGRWSELYSERRPNGVPCLTLDLRPTPRARLSLSVKRPTRMTPRGGFVH